MQTNGLRPFSFHRHERPEIAEALRPIVGVQVEPPPGKPAVAMLDAETAARRYLAEAFASDRLPSFTSMEIDGQPSEFRTLGTEALPLKGTTTVKFRQLSRRIPVYGSLVTVELDDDNALISINSALGEPSNVSPVATVSPAQALEVVSRAAGYTGTVPEITPRLHYYFDPGKQRWHLAYIAENVLQLSADGGRAPAVFDYVVDALSGELIARLPRTQSAELVSSHESPASHELRASREAHAEPAVDELGVTRQLPFRPDGGIKVMTDEENNVATYDFRFRDLARDERALPGDSVSLPPEPWASAGVSAHANAVEVARFLKTVLKREGLDNRGGPFISSINCCYRGEGGGKEWRNAAWIGTQMVYGQRRVGSRLVSYAAALDVVAHEILHGLTDHTARLEYAAMSGAMNESYSDIFGVIVSNLDKPGLDNWNWQMGEELDETGIPIRDLRSPSLYDQPEHMRDYRELPVDQWNDWGGVHINSGIHNKAAYNLLTSRGSDGGYLFDPKSVAALFYIALSQYLSRTSTFSDSRRGVGLAARSLFRRDPALEEKLQAIARAFEAVGIGTGLPAPEAVSIRPGAPTPMRMAELETIMLASVTPPLVIPYDPYFLGDGFEVPLPGLTDRARSESFQGGRVLDYVHYSLVMNERRRTAHYTACNIDAARMVRLGRTGLPWVFDARLPPNAQLGPSYYAGNDWDRGHLVRRQDPIWGPVRVAREANASTFYFTNAAPQHANFNQDEWLVLEDWVLERATDFAYRLCVFTGPVLRDDDIPLGDAKVPAGFWKIIALRDATADGQDLSVVAFFMKQTEMSRDKLGKDLLQLKRYQVTVAAVEEWTGLDFGDLNDADELAWLLMRLRVVRPEEKVEPFRLITRPEDIVFTGDSRRAMGARIYPAPEELPH
ncbi:MAG: DNA/RNA non-specific endonuclease [Myxococcaceae bacterium]